MIYFLTIDLKSANFQILKQEGLIIDNSWKDLLKRQLEIINPSVIESNALEFLNKSKSLRLKTLSKFDYKEHYIIAGNIILTVLDSLIKNNIVDEKDFYLYNGDEIIFKVDDLNKDILKEKCENYLKKQYPNLEMHIEVFLLIKLDSGNHYAKFNENTNKVSFKCVKMDDLLDVVKAWDKIII